MNKCVFVVGPESTGSKLISRILADALGVVQYSQWDGTGCVDNGKDKLCHRSLPYGIPPRYPDIADWINKHRDDYELFFVITTRDITLSETSRIKRFPKNLGQVRRETKHAKMIISELLKSNNKCYIFSYETFMFLQIDYLRKLYEFLGIDSTFIPELIDGNVRRIRQA